MEDNLLRLSVGIEAVEDLIYDIDQAINYPKWKRKYPQETNAGKIKNLERLLEL